MKSAIFITAILLTPVLYADSVILLSEPEMVATADFIAIVQFQDAKYGNYKGLAGYPKQKEQIVRRFSRCVSVRVIENLKGYLPEEIQIYDNSGRWDSLFHNHHDHSKSDSGRHLIFLSGDVNFLTGTNGWASTSPITDGKIQWVKTPKSPKVDIVNLGEILDLVRNQIEPK